MGGLSSDRGAPFRDGIGDHIIHNNWHDAGQLFFAFKYTNRNGKIRMALIVFVRLNHLRSNVFAPMLFRNTQKVHIIHIHVLIVSRTGPVPYLNVHGTAGNQSTKRRQRLNLMSGRVKMRVGAHIGGYKTWRSVPFKVIPHISRSWCVLHIGASVVVAAQEGDAFGFQHFGQGALDSGNGCRTGSVRCGGTIGVRLNACVVHEPVVGRQVFAKNAVVVEPIGPVSIMEHGLDVPEWVPREKEDAPRQKHEKDT